MVVYAEADSSALTTGTSENREQHKHWESMMVSRLCQALVFNRPSDVTLSSALCIALLLTCTDTSSAQALSCDELRPVRGTELNLDGDVKVEAGFITKRIIGGEADLSGKYSLKEVFPEVFGGQDLFDIERFYYTLCLALSDPAIDPERRFSMLMQANRERQATLREAFNEQITSEDPQAQINAIDWATDQEGSLQSQAIELGLESNSATVQAAAVEAALATSDVVAGTVLDEKSGTSASFSILMSQKTRAGNAMNFGAEFQGGIFRMTKGTEQAQGSLRGNTLSVSNKACSLSASLRNERSVLEGTLTCDPYISIANYPDSARVMIPLY